MMCRPLTLLFFAFLIPLPFSAGLFPRAFLSFILPYPLPFFFMFSPIFFPFSASIFSPFTANLYFRLGYLLLVQILFRFFSPYS